MLKPAATEARNALGNLLLAQGRVGGVEAEYAAALGVGADDPLTHLKIGNVAVGKGELGKALQHFRQAAKLSPSLSVARNNAGIVLARQGKTGEAIAHHRSGLRAEPGNARIHFTLVRADQGFAEARRRLAEATMVRGR